MKTLKFKTNIKCGACINTVTPSLNETVGQEHWQVDLTSPERVLSVQTDTVSPEKLVDTLSKVGYKAELLASV
jgi:copper chaperone CopZ